MKNRYKNLIRCSTVMLLLFFGRVVHAQTPFTCTDAVSYQIIGNPSALYTVDLRTGAKTLLHSAATLGNRNLTGLGYNVNDNFLYASVSGTDDIVKIGSDGVVELIDVFGLLPQAYTSGDVSPNGTLFLYVASSTTMQLVNLATLSVSNIILNAGANAQDISISPDGTRIYGISAGNGNLVSWPINGGPMTNTDVGITAVSASSFMDSTGDLFIISDGSSSVYEVSGPSFPNENSLTRITPNLGTAITNTDGARCVTSLATTQPAFSCTPNQAFVSTSGVLPVNNCDEVGTTQSQLLEYSLATGTVTNTSNPLIQAFGTLRGSINNLGYNPVDNFLWAYRTGTNQLVRIGQDRTVDFFAIPGISNNCNYPGAGNTDNTFFFSGDIDDNGVMYLLNGILGDRFVRVDLNPSSPTYLTKLSDVVLTPFSPSSGMSSIQDLAFNPIDGFLYTISANNNLIRINPASGLVTNVGAVTGIPSTGSGYVVAYFDNAGTLYVQRANNTDIVKVPNVANDAVAGSIYGNGASFSGGDGARCAKSAVAPVLYSLSGNVFDDGNGLNDVGGALVNTSGAGAYNPLNGESNLGVPLYVTLVTSNGDAIATVPVTSTGTYTFNDLAPDSYSTVLSTDPNGTTAGNSPLPSGWVYTGEQVGTVAGGTDGTVNGIVSGISLTNANITNANFGIDKKPVVNNGTDTTRINPGGTTTSPVSGSLFTGTDLEDVSYPNNLSGRIVNLEPGTNGDVYYNGVKVVVADAPIANFDPELVTVDPQGTSNQDIITVTFTYTVDDNAGISSDPKTIQVPFTADPLPVTLTSFNASTVEDHTARLDWTTSFETNSEKFEVEHSRDGKVWNKLTEIAALGESSNSKSYQYEHLTPAFGENLYRLKMVDFDGTFAYSRIRSLYFDQGASIQIFPNPVSSTLFMNVDKDVQIKEIVIRNNTGQTLLKYDSMPTNGISVRHLPAGLYMMTTTDLDGSVSTYKVIVNR
ncbi:T9SS type A sorting domain-containing protein [Dyadobacter tibetensis]|uniref:T9SS type A sorting domain-containing protein n=1 Tax=Dyadobacter tibetensis TaxID=1211851 RepID=UPI0004711841|nr:T9SS type A sorting domain-containing protein [Dyadobacter tibetensis]